MSRNQRAKDVKPLSFFSSTRSLQSMAFTSNANDCSKVIRADISKIQEILAGAKKQADVLQQQAITRNRFISTLPQHSMPDTPPTPLQVQLLYSLVRQLTSQLREKETYLILALEREQAAQATAQEVSPTDLSTARKVDMPTDAKTPPPASNNEDPVIQQDPTHWFNGAAGFYQKLPNASSKTTITSHSPFS